MRSFLVTSLLVCMLGGCASQNVAIRNLPPETRAANNATAAESTAALAAATETATTAPPSAEKITVPTAPPLTPADAPPMRTYDPWERANRFTYRFNARFDEAIFLPVANGYRHIPSPIRAGVHNFFGNLGEVDSVINYALQWRIGLGVRSLGRFLINSTAGIGGLFDVADKVRLASAPTGFSTTLSKWGMHPGPFLVIPILGPSTLRDSFGLLANFATSYAINLADLYRGDASYALGVVNAVDQRSNVSFRYYSTGSPFEYETVRFLYVRKRLIEDEGLHAKDPPKKRNADAPAGQ